MDADRREVHCKTACQLNASLGGLDKLRYICMTWIEAGIRVDNTDDRPGQCVFAVAHYSASDVFSNYFKVEVPSEKLTARHVSMASMACTNNVRTLAAL